MTEKLRIAVVGCGYWGSKHVRVLSQLSGVEVVLVDIDQRRRESLAQTFPSATSSFGHLEDALEVIDAAVIATKPTTHHTLAAAALEAGVHVLVEKPLATSIPDSLHLIRMAEQRDLVLMTGHTFEYNPAVWKLKEIVSSPEFGDILYIDAARLNLGLYQPDVNVLWDLAPHDISIINFLLERLPTEVCAWGSRHADLHEDVGYLQLRYGATSLTANVHVSWLDPCKVRRITVVGTHQMAVYDDVATDDRIRVYDKGLERGMGGAMHEQPLSYRIGDITSPFIDFREPLQIEAEQFVDAIRENTQPQSDGWSGLEVVRVLVAADQSLRSGMHEAIAPLPTGAPPVEEPIATAATPATPLNSETDELTASVQRMLLSFDGVPSQVPQPAPTTAVPVELVGVPANVVAQAMVGELALVGFAPRTTSGRQIAVHRADGAAVTLAEQSATFDDNLTRLLLGAERYPIDNAVDAISVGLRHMGYSLHASTDAFILTHRSGFVVKIGRQPQAGFTSTGATL